MCDNWGRRWLVGPVSLWSGIVVQVAVTGPQILARSEACQAQSGPGWQHLPTVAASTITIPIIQTRAVSPSTETRCSVGASI